MNPNELNVSGLLSSEKNMSLYDTIFSVGIMVVIVIIALLVIGYIFAKLYKRASKEVSYVRTGLGGQKVIMNGGAVLLPIVHEVIPVNMNTLRLEVKRASEQALITRDRMRVDVTAEFYVRVKPSADSIANAAQTLGMKTMKPNDLKDLVEGKFVDALRSVAAEMDMEQLHEKRVDFVQKVQQVVSEDLLKNGLELETVSLTGLDQTSREFFNPNNAFDAQGLTKLTKEIEDRRKIRNDIEQETEIAIASKNLEASRQRFDIQREEEYARLDQELEIQSRSAQQKAEIARKQAESKQESEEASITAEQKIRTATIMSEKLVEEENIEKERLLEERRIAKKLVLDTAEIQQKKAVELSEQERQIAVAEKSKAESEAQALADKARALAVKERETVQTVREVEIAERLKTIELVKARQAAEKEAISVTVAADAKKQASEDEALALRLLAEGTAQKARIEAKGLADAVLMRAEADAKRFEVEAQGARLLNEAANILSSNQIDMQVKIEMLKQLPEIISQSVKPMERIDNIKIVQVDGLQGGASASAGEGGHNGNLSDQVVNSALRYRSQAPLVDSLLKEVGMDASSLNGMTAAFTENLVKPQATNGSDVGNTPVS